MAEAILNVVVEGVLKKALEYASEELSLLWGFQDDLQKLSKTLNTIQSLLLDADKKHITLSSVHLWLKDLSSVAMDADDVLDEFGYQVLSQQVLGSQKFKLKVRYYISSSNPFLARHVFSRKIKKVNSKFDHVYKRANDIGLRPVELLHTSAQLTEIRKSDPFVNESMVLGRDDDIEKVLEMLELSMSEKLDVVGIVGMGGQGKTTLAQVVYKNERVVSLFIHRMWICVSYDFNVDRLLKEMMQCIGLSRSNELSNREKIIEEIKKKLDGKTYLLVLDDVWTEKPDEWEDMRNCLINVGSPVGNKVLVTTRSHNVVSAMKSSRFHLLKGLLDDHSWELFSNIAFAEGGPVQTENLTTIGQKMVKRCGRVPLAIKTLADLMWTLKDENEWLLMEEDERWDSESSEDRVLSTLKLSYDHLPSLSLKQCFAYCSLFKKDTILEREKLIQLWVAQGLLKPLKGSHDPAHLEYLVGNNHFNVLMQKSFFDNLERDEYGIIVSCKMHDLVHDLSLKISKDYCSMLLQGQENVINEATHLISNGKQFLQSPKGHFSKLRTLYLVGGVSPIGLDILVSLKSLRALIIEDRELKELPHSIGKLKHLRFLDISETLIGALPNSICKLFYLQTLRLNYLNQLPPKFKNLVNLRYFHILHEFGVCPLPHVGQLTHLQTLPYFLVYPMTGCEIKQLGELSCLKGTLKIYGLKHVIDDQEAKVAKLSNKSGVVSLQLDWNNQQLEIDAINSDEAVCKDVNVLENLEPHPNLKSLEVFNYGGTHLSCWLLERSSSVLQNLVKIKLMYFDKCEHVPALGRLPCLKMVGLYGLENVKRIGNEFYGLTDYDVAAGDSFSAFPMLKEIILEDMPSLEKWEHPSGLNLFLKLGKFQVRKCPELTCLPDMKNLDHLQVFKIDECSVLKHLPIGLRNCVSLRTIKIRSCNNLTCLPDMKNLRHLQKFKIAECSALNHLPAELESCVSLRTMEIQNCPSLLTTLDMHNFPNLLKLTLTGFKSWNDLPNGIESLASLKELGLGFTSEVDSFPWPGPTSVAVEENGRTLQPFAALASLKLFGWEKLTHLPKQLEKLPALSSLLLYKFDGLEDLPEWLANVHTLQRLSLIKCQNLKHLPRLRKLENLQIADCPLLEEACLQRRGPQWENIKHIPCYEIYTAAPDGSEYGISVDWDLAGREHSEDYAESSWVEQNSKIPTCSNMFAGLSKTISRKICMRNRANRSEDH